MLLYPLSFILLLTPLVFVHELGHFLFAKLFGIRVDTFSIGFGPKIFRRTKGETEYCISAVPLGGYVKLLGQDPSEQVAPEFRDRTFMSKKPWQRFLVLVGGPLFNFIFAIMVFAAMLMIGEENLSTKIGRVVPGSQAYVAGFRAGDYITAVNDHAVTKFEDVAQVISDSANTQLKMRVKRGSESSEFKDITVVPRPVDGMSIYGEPKKVGDIEGLINVGRYPVISVEKMAKSPAVQAGLKTGDVIVTFNGTKVASFEELEALQSKAMHQGVKEFRLGIQSVSFSDWASAAGPGAGDRKFLEEAKADKEVVLPARSLEKLGIASSELVIANLLPDSPAQKAGLQAGDHILSVSGRELNSFFELREEIQRLGEKQAQVVVTVTRNGVVSNKQIVPIANETKDPLTGSSRSFAIGVYPLLVHSEPDVFVERIYNPLTLASIGWSRAVDLSVKTAVSLKKLFFRQVSMGTLGGPLLIGKLAGDSISRGISSFLRVMALISISLAIFNILPIPVLDGGHILLLGVEVVRGRPLGLKQAEFIQQIGLSFIMLLLVVVLFNDFSRVALPAFQNVFR